MASLGPGMDHAQNGQWATTSRTYHGKSWRLIKHDVLQIFSYWHNILQQQNLVSPGSLPTSLFRLAMSILWPSCEFPHTKKICTKVFFCDKSWGHGTRLTHASTSSWLTNALREAPLGSMKVMFSASCLRGKRPLVSSNVLRYLKDLRVMQVAKKHLKAVNKIHLERLWHIHTKF